MSACPPVIRLGVQIASQDTSCLASNHLARLSTFLFYFLRPSFLCYKYLCMIIYLFIYLFIFLCCEFALLKIHPFFRFFFLFIYLVLHFFGQNWPYYWFFLSFFFLSFFLCNFTFILHSRVISFLFFLSFFLSFFLYFFLSFFLSFPFLLFCPFSSPLIYLFIHLSFLIQMSGEECHLLSSRPFSCPISQLDFSLKGRTDCFWINGKRKGKTRLR